jgi:hypothetical protein
VCAGPTSHVLGRFHPAMRIHHVAQAAKGWPAATPADREEEARLADAVERIQWRLWHGQVRRALDLTGETLAWLGSVADAASSSAAKVTSALRGLETCVAGQASLIIDHAKARPSLIIDYAKARPSLIIDYAKARRDGEAISTATMEGAVRWPLRRRMGAGHQMRRSPRGAHRMLRVRTAVAGGTPADDHAAAERWARRPFRRAARPPGFRTALWR